MASCKSPLQVEQTPLVQILQPAGQDLHAPLTSSNPSVHLVQELTVHVAQPGIGHLIQLVLVLSYMKPGLQTLHKAGAIGLAQSSQLLIQATQAVPDKVFPGLQLRQLLGDVAQVKHESAHFKQALAELA